MPYDRRYALGPSGSTLGIDGAERHPNLHRSMINALMDKGARMISSSRPGDPHNDVRRLSEFMGAIGMPTAQPILAVNNLQTPMTAEQLYAEHGHKLISIQSTVAPLVAAYNPLHAIADVEWTNQQNITTQVIVTNYTPRTASTLTTIGRTVGRHLYEGTTHGHRSVGTQVSSLEVITDPVFGADERAMMIAALAYQYYIDGGDEILRGIRKAVITGDIATMHKQERRQFGISDLWALQLSYNLTFGIINAQGTNGLVNVASKLARKIRENGGQRDSSGLVHVFVPQRMLDTIEKATKFQHAKTLDSVRKVVLHESIRRVMGLEIDIEKIAGYYNQNEFLRNSWLVPDQNIIIHGIPTPPLPDNVSMLRPGAFEGIHTTSTYYRARLVDDSGSITYPHLTDAHGTFTIHTANFKSAAVTATDIMRNCHWWGGARAGRGSSGAATGSGFTHTPLNPRAAQYIRNLDANRLAKNSVARVVAKYRDPAETAYKLTCEMPVDDVLNLSRMPVMVTAGMQTRFTPVVAGGGPTAAEGGGGGRRTFDETGEARTGFVTSETSGKAGSSAPYASGGGGAPPLSVSKTATLASGEVIGLDEGVRFTQRKYVGGAIPGDLPYILTHGIIKELAGRLSTLCSRNKPYVVNFQKQVNQLFRVANQIAMIPNHTADPKRFAERAGQFLTDLVRVNVGAGDIVQDPVDKVTTIRTNISYNGLVLPPYDDAYGDAYLFGCSSGPMLQALANVDDAQTTLEISETRCRSIYELWKMLREIREPLNDLFAVLVGPAFEDSLIFSTHLLPPWLRYNDISNTVGNAINCTIAHLLGDCGILATVTVDDFASKPSSTAPVSGMRSMDILKSQLRAAIVHADTGKLLINPETQSIATNLIETDVLASADDLSLWVDFTDHSSATTKETEFLKTFQLGAEHDVGFIGIYARLIAELKSHTTVLGVMKCLAAEWLRAYEDNGGRPVRYTSDTLDEFVQAVIEAYRDDDLKVLAEMLRGEIEKKYKLDFRGKRLYGDSKAERERITLRLPLHYAGAWKYRTGLVEALRAKGIVPCAYGNDGNAVRDLTEWLSGDKLPTTITVAEHRGFDAFTSAPTEVYARSGRSHLGATRDAAGSRVIRRGGRLFEHMRLYRGSGNGMLDHSELVQANMDPIELHWLQYRLDEFQVRNNISLEKMFDLLLYVAYLWSPFDEKVFQKWTVSNTTQNNVSVSIPPPMDFAAIAFAERYLTSDVIAAAEGAVKLYTTGLRLHPELDPRSTRFILNARARHIAHVPDAGLVGISRNAHAQPIGGQDITFVTAEQMASSNATNTKMGSLIGVLESPTRHWKSYTFLDIKENETPTQLTLKSKEVTQVAYGNPWSMQHYIMELFKSFHTQISDSLTNIRDKMGKTFVATDANTTKVDPQAALRAEMDMRSALGMAALSWRGTISVNSNVSLSFTRADTFTPSRAISRKLDHYDSVLEPLG